jgi:GNAT superfamily N-acetyltransferase
LNAARRPLFSWTGGQALDTTDADIPAVQIFWQDSPEYLLQVEGHAPRASEGADFVRDRDLPPGFSCTRQHNYTYADAHGAVDGLGAMAIDLLAPGVWHLGLFVAATRLHGSDWAAQAYEATEAWAQAGGARWMRLGVVLANPRGHAFWRRQGYVEVKRRPEVSIGELSHTLVTMVKPLSASVADYLEVVERDRP